MWFGGKLIGEVPKAPRKRRKKRPKFILRKQYAIFRPVVFPDKSKHEVFLGTVWAKHEVEALVLAAKQYPKRTLTAKKTYGK